MKTEKLNAVLRFATEAHKGQVRKMSEEPYINHPVRIAERMQTLDGSPETAIAAALLHDVLEDCPAITSGSLLDSLVKIGFTETESLEIVDIVLRLSRPCKKKQNIIDYLNRINEHSYARLIKKYDLEDNMADLPAGNLLDKYKLCCEYLSRG